MEVRAALFVLLTAASAIAQSNAIKATSRVLPDGSTLTTITNPETQTREETVSQPPSRTEAFAGKSGRVLSKKIYTLNEQNFATGVTHFDGKGAVRYREVFTFDGNGRVTESKLFSPVNQPLGRRVFIYDTNVENQARIEDYDAAGRLIARPVPAPVPAGRGIPDKKKRR
jgi:hypothetical protein